MMLTSLTIIGMPIKHKINNVNEYNVYAYMYINNKINEYNLHDIKYNINISKVSMYEIQNINDKVNQNKIHIHK